MKDGSPRVRVQKLLQCRDVLQCIFNLNPLEIEIYRLLNRNGPLPADEIGERTGRDRSTAYRALRNLQACRIVYKETDILDNGGYRHLYHVVAPTEVQREMKDCLEEWHCRILAVVDNFPAELRTSLEKEY